VGNGVKRERKSRGEEAKIRISHRGRRGSTECTERREIVTAISVGLKCCHGPSTTARKKRGPPVGMTEFGKDREAKRGT
jgi:hypothetical protein